MVNIANGHATTSPATTDRRDRTQRGTSAPPASNPFMDDHLIYAAVLVVLTLLGAGTTLGLGRRWAATPLVRRNTWLT
jgi:hypothetical protein